MSGHAGRCFRDRRRTARRKDRQRRAVAAMRRALPEPARQGFRWAALAPLQQQKLVEAYNALLRAIGRRR
jgi:hypothetical protein